MGNEPRYILTALKEYSKGKWFEPWYQDGSIVLEYLDEYGEPTTKTWYYDDFPDDTLVMSCGGWNRHGIIHWIGIDLDVGHGKEDQQYSTIKEALLVAYALRAYVNGACEVRHSKSGRGLHARIAIKPIDGGHEIARRVAWWLSDTLQLKCDHSVLGRQSLSFDCYDPNENSFKLVSPCVGQWTVPHAATIHKPSSNAVAVPEPELEKEMWNGYSIEERQHQYRTVIMSDKFPCSISGCGGDAQLRDTCGIRYAFGLSAVDAYEVLIEYNQEKCDPPWPDGIIIQKLNNAKYFNDVGDKLRESHQAKVDRIKSKYRKMPGYRDQLKRFNSLGR